jgi:seryl-tRNA(Sec) selenium transferase
MRRSWAKYINSYSFAEGARIRIALKSRLGRKPTEKEVIDAHEAGETFQVTYEEVDTAFSAGEEVSTHCASCKYTLIPNKYIATAVLKCVGYDESLQREIVKRLEQGNESKQLYIYLTTKYHASDRKRLDPNRIIILI